MSKKRNVAPLIFLGFVLLLLFIPILAQKLEYNKYVILLFGILMFSSAIFFSSLVFISFKNLKFEDGKLKQNFIAVILLIFFYYFITLLISVGIFGTLSSFLSESFWKNFPEYGTFLIPTISLSMLLLYRILGLFGQEVVLKPARANEKNSEIIRTFNEALSPKEMRDRVRDLIVGTLFISSIAIFFMGAGVFTFTKYVFAFNLFALISSPIVVSIELLIRYFKNNLHNEFQLDIVKVKSSQHPIKVKAKLHNRVASIIFTFVLITALIYAFAWVVKYQNAAGSNSAVLNISVKEISINITKPSINETDAVIPLANINGEEKPLTERLDYLVNNNLASYEFLNKSLEVSTKQETYPLNTTLRFQNSLNCYPPDYDTIIIYAFYKNGYSNFRLACNYQDYGTEVFAEKFFFNLNNNDNVVIDLKVNGATFTVIDYEIKIITLNETLGKNIKNLLEEDRNKANITLISENPIRRPVFNSVRLQNQ